MFPQEREARWNENPADMREILINNHGVVGASEAKNGISERMVGAGEVKNAIDAQIHTNIEQQVQVRIQAGSVSTSFCGLQFKPVLVQISLETRF